MGRLGSRCSVLPALSAAVSQCLVPEAASLQQMINSSRFAALLVAHLVLANLVQSLSSPFYSVFEDELCFPVHNKTLHEQWQSCRAEHCVSLRAADCLAHPHLSL